MKIGITLLTLAPLLSVAVHSEAAVMAYDGFSSADGNASASENLAGQASGTGFSGAWTASETGNERDLLSFQQPTGTDTMTFPSGTGYTPSETTQRHHAGSSGGGYGEGHYYRALSSSISMDTDGEATYVSWLGRLGGTDSANAVGLGKLNGTSGVDGGTPTNITFGMGNYFRNGGGLLGAGPWAITTDKGTNGFGSILASTKDASGPYAAINTTYYMVGKITTSSTGNDTIQFSWYAPGDTVPLAESWMLTGSADLTGDYDYLSINAGGFSDSRFDEIRVADTWESAVAPVPEPSSTLLLGLSSVVFFRRRR